MAEETMGKMEATAHRKVGNAWSGDEKISVFSQEKSMRVTVKSHRTRKILKTQQHQNLGYKRGGWVINYIEDLLKNELAQSIGLTKLSIERAHRELVQSLKCTTKEKILGPDWKKTINVEGRKVIFLIMLWLKKGRNTCQLKRHWKSEELDSTHPWPRCVCFWTLGPWPTRALIKPLRIYVQKASQSSHCQSGERQRNQPSPGSE